MPSMYGIFTYIWVIFMVNIGESTIHGSYIWVLLPALPVILSEIGVSNHLRNAEYFFVTILSFGELVDPGWAGINLVVLNHEVKVFHDLGCLSPRSPDAGSWQGRWSLVCRGGQLECSHVKGSPNAHVTFRRGPSRREQTHVIYINATSSKKRITKLHRCCFEDVEDMPTHPCIVLNTPIRTWHP